MTLLIAGDIGGTKTILRLVETTSSGLHPLHEERYPSGNFSDLVPIVQQFLDATQQLGKHPVPKKACFAIAGPVVNNTAKLTNLPWSLDAKRLEQELGISSVSLINDFAAVGYGVLGLEASDLYTLQICKPQQAAPIAVIGAGTGLGEGFLIHQLDSYQVFASEGGHADFAPRSQLEYELLQDISKRHQVDRVSVERVVSGQGVIAIYQFLRDRAFAEESPDIGQVVRNWEQQKSRSEKTAAPGAALEKRDRPPEQILTSVETDETVDPAATIAAAALEKRDRLSEQTMQMFVEAYGAEAGNLALKLLPYGGLYVAGGIAAKILPLIQEGSFIRTFAQKGRVSPLLKDVPVHVVLNPQVGLIGAAICADKL